MSHNYLSKILNGTGAKEGLGIEKAQAIAQAAKVDLRWLLTGEGNPDGTGSQRPLPRPPERSLPPDFAAMIHGGGHKNHRALQAIVLMRDWLLPAATEALLLEEPHDDWTIDQWQELARELNAKAKQAKAEAESERPSQKMTAARPDKSLS